MCDRQTVRPTHNIRINRRNVGLITKPLRYQSWEVFFVMSVDPRKGKKRAAARIRTQTATVIGSTSLDLAFDLFYSAKRAENIRERTLADYRSYWRYFNEWLKRAYPNVNMLRQLTTEIIRDYVAYMQHDHTRYGSDPYRMKDDRKLSPATVKSRLRAIQTMCAFWFAEGLADSDPAEKIRAPRMDLPERAGLTDNHVSAILNAPDKKTFVGFRDRTLILLLVDCGLRISEALNLRIQHFDFKSRCIRLPAEMNKNRKPRIIPTSAAVVREVIRLIEENQYRFDTDYIFVSDYGEPLKADHFRKRLRHYANIAGIDTTSVQVSPHRFRDYFITNYLLNGGDLFTLQRIVAHADIKTTQGYVRLNEDVIRDSHAEFSPIRRLLKRGDRK